ncbi:MAG: M10 family metallopeptidase C-terminal domain-containing protein [Paracoccaceae bacterium]
MARDYSFGSDVLDASGLIRHAALRETGDVVGSTATTARISVGDTFQGWLTGVDSDWVAVDLVAGQNYVFTAYGTGGTAGLVDPQLGVRSSAGALLAFNEDAEPGNFTSMVRFTPTAGGTYYLDIRTVGNAQGQYTLRSATDVFTIEQVASQLTDSSWGNAGSALHLPITAAGTVTVNLNALSADGRTLARMALETWTAYTGITFAETGSAGAMIRFDDLDAAIGGGIYAFAGPLGISPGGSYTSAMVTISEGWVAANGTAYGSYSYVTYLHEIGHALGLGHPGFYDGDALYGRDNHYLNDSYQMTIMSYFDMDANTFVTGTNFHPLTPMAADIAAMQYLYGTSPSVFAGNTVWGANSNISGRLGTAMNVMFDGAARPGWMAAGQQFGFTIVDSGGIDTMDFSRTGVAQLIDMRQGGISNVHGAVGTVVVALGTVIENAVGGTGADTIHGNDADNFIMALAGDDVIYAGAGNDVVYSSFGNDYVEAGDGHDEVWGAAGNDTLYGGNGNDTMGGGIGDDMLYGGDGQDNLWGGVGNDMIGGGAGADEIAGGGGNDTVYGGDGNDTIYGAPGNDLLHGGDGDDFIWGGTGSDTIFGGAGDDTIAPGADNDTVTGGEGADTFVFYRNNGVTRITDFAPGEGDRLQLSSLLWEGQFGALTAQEVETRFASLDGNGNTVLAFVGTSIILAGFTDFAVLDQHITII